MSGINKIHLIILHKKLFHSSSLYYSFGVGCVVILFSEERIFPRLKEKNLNSEILNSKLIL